MLDSRFRGVSTENWRRRERKDCDVSLASRENVKRVFGKRFDFPTRV